MRFGTIRLSTGPRLQYTEYGDGTGTPIVFLHGWPDSWFSFSAVAQLLPDNHRLLLFDQRGFGESDRPEAGYDIRSFAQDVVAFLDAMSVQRATLVGHSFGTFVARAAAIAHPERVERLVLIDTGWTGANDVTREVYASLDDLKGSVSEEFAREFQASTAYAPVPDAFFERLIAESLKLPAPLWSKVLGAIIEYDDTNDLGAIAAPTLVIWGDRDALFGREDQERVAAAIPGARLLIYPDIGHCPNWECPDRVATDLTAFVRSG
jgi:pimeloyl-ACP methyl ester carboxylesterase